MVGIDLRVVLQVLLLLLETSIATAELSITLGDRECIFRTSIWNGIETLSRQKPYFPMGEDCDRLTAFIQITRC